MDSGQREAEHGVHRALDAKVGLVAPKAKRSSLTPILQEAWLQDACASRLQRPRASRSGSRPGRLLGRAAPAQQGRTSFLVGSRRSSRLACRIDVSMRDSRRPSATCAICGGRVTRAARCFGRGGIPSGGKPAGQQGLRWTRSAATASRAPPRPWCLASGWPPLRTRPGQCGPPHLVHLGLVKSEVGVQVAQRVLNVLHQLRGQRAGQAEARAWAAAHLLGSPAGSQTGFDEAQPQPCAAATFRCDRARQQTHKQAGEQAGVQACTQARMHTR